MSFGENELLEQVNSLKTKIATMEGQIEPLKEKTRHIRETLCAREVSGGGFEIDFNALADRLGLEGAMEMRAAIDERWKVSGGAGEKPRIRVQAAA